MIILKPSLSQDNTTASLTLTNGLTALRRGIPNQHVWRVCPIAKLVPSFPIKYGFIPELKNEGQKWKRMRPIWQCSCVSVCVWKGKLLEGIFWLRVRNGKKLTILKISNKVQSVTAADGIGFSICCCCWEWKFDLDSELSFSFEQNISVSVDAVQDLYSEKTWCLKYQTNRV